MNKQEEDKQRQAKRALQDISNQDEWVSRSHWFKKSLTKKCKKQQDNRLPSISSCEINVKSSKQINSLIFRKRSQMQKQRMEQLLRVMTKKRSLPNYNLNKKLMQQMEMIDNNRQSSDYLKLSRQQKNQSFNSNNNKSKIKNKYKKCLTENQGEITQNQVQQQQNNTSNIQKHDLAGKISDKQENKIRKNWSLNMSKILKQIEDQQSNYESRRQIEEIRSLIRDKRVKFRRLSKQGIIIIKNLKESGRKKLQSDNKTLQSRNGKTQSKYMEQSIVQKKDVLNNGQRQNNKNELIANTCQPKMIYDSSKEKLSKDRVNLTQNSIKDQKKSNNIIQQSSQKDQLIEKSKEENQASQIHLNSHQREKDEKQILNNSKHRKLYFKEKKVDECQMNISRKDIIKCKSTTNYKNKDKKQSDKQNLFKPTKIEIQSNKNSQKEIQNENQKFYPACQATSIGKRMKHPHSTCQQVINNKQLPCNNEVKCSVFSLIRNNNPLVNKDKIQRTFLENAYTILNYPIMMNKSNTNCIDTIYKTHDYNININKGGTNDNNCIRSRNDNNNCIRSRNDNNNCIRSRNDNANNLHVASQ